MSHFSIWRSWNTSSRQRAARRRNFLSRTLRCESLESRALLAAQITALNVDSLFGDPDGDGIADPGDQIHYTVTVQNTGDAPATNLTFQEILNDPNLTLVAGSINVSPLAINDTFTAVANTQLRVGNPSALGGPAAVVAGSVIANDVEFLGDSFSISAFQATSAQGGAVSMVTSGADAGSFYYMPQAGDTGADSFTYTLRDDGIDGIAGNSDDLTSVGTVNITIGTQQVWYVDNTAGTTGDGTSSNPFDSLADVSGASGLDGTGDIIFVHTGSGDYTGGITLVDDQTLWGENQALVVDGFTLQAAGTDPTIVSGSGNGVTLEQGNTLKGFTVGNTSGFDIANTTTATVGTLTISNVILNGTGGLFRADSGGTLNVTFDSAGTTSTSGHGIHLAGSSGGSFTVSAGAISGVAGTDVLVSGGTAAISIASSITSSAGGSVEIASHGTNNVTISGALNITGGTGISVHDNSGGTIAFSNGSKVISTGANAAVNLASNSGATINFTGGGLDFDTTSGTGFGATGGGTISVTGTGNTITSTSGIALNIVSTTIGGSGLTFRSISSGNNDGGADPTSGIVLNNTGTNGGLTVTGDTGSSNNSSGGTIQSTTGAGISLTNTRDVSLDQMNIQNTVGSGIDGRGTSVATAVTNFSFTNGTINNSGTGGAAQTSNIGFNDQDGGNEINFVGSLTVTGSTLTNAHYHGVSVFNFGGAINNANISNNTVTSSTSTANSLGTGIQLIAFSGADVTKATIDNNDITNFPSDAGIMVQGGNVAEGGDSGNLGDVTVSGGNTTGDATNVIAITNNTISGQNAANRIGTQGILANVNGTGEGNFNISGNQITNTVGNAISNNIFGDAVVFSTISNNTIVKGDGGNPQLATSGIVGGVGQTSGFATNDPSWTAMISGNNISGTDGNGILLVAREDVVHDDGFELTLKITNNTIAAPLGGVRPGIRVDAGNDATDDNDVRLEISGNTSGGSSGSAGIGVRRQGTDATAPLDNEFAIEGLSPSPANETQTEDHISALNPGSALGTGALGGPSRALVINGNNFTSAVVPLMFASGGVEAAAPLSPPVTSTPSTEILPQGNVASPSTHSTPPVDTTSSAHSVIVDDGILSQTELYSLVAAAIARWQATGLSAAQASLLHSVTFTIADLPGWYLGSASPGVVTLDANAAGNAWFIDATPLDDSEFAGNGTKLTATATGGAKGRVDALTTIMHELGHQLGLDDSYAGSDATNLMYGWIGQSERRLAAAGQALGADPSEHEHDGPDFLFGSMNLGTLPDGKSVTIVYDATVNAMTSGVAVTVSSQVRIQGDGGINVLSDDPAAGGAADPTTTTVDSITLGNLVFEDVDVNGVFDGADAGIDGVTVKLYVDDGDGVLDAGDGAAIASTTTAGGGLYSFSVLPGEYLVEIPAANFQAGGALVSKLSTGGAAIDPDNNANNDDNGVNNAAPATNGISSSAITLDYDTEPQADGTGQFDVNNTLDFGFYDNLPPVLANSSTIDYTENDGARVIATLLTVTDADTAGLASATVTITNFVAGEDVLSFTNDGATMGNVAVSSNVGGVITLTSAGATATPDEWTQALHGVRYENSSDDPDTTPRLVEFVINDGTDDSNTLTNTINVTAVNDPPVLGGSGSITYTENDGPTNIAPTLTVADVDSTGLASASVTITNFFAGEDTLSFSNDGLTMGNIAFVNNVGGVLTLESAGATATPAQWQSALRAVRYGNSSDSPNTPPRSVEFVVNDGTADSNPLTNTINITATNDAPSFTSPAVTSATEDVLYSYSITTQDLDAGATLTITAPTLPAWLTLTDNGDGTATLSGTPTNSEVGDHNVVLELFDGIAPPVQQSFTITVANVNDAPTFTSAPVTAATEDAAYAYNITTEDVDVGATVTITAPTLPAWLTFVDNGDGTATLSGTPTNAEVGDHNVVLEVSDGIAPAVQQSFTITVANTNDAPVLDDSLSPALTTIDEDDVTSAGTLVSDLLVGAVSDVDAGAVEGIAVTAASTLYGTWEYSLDGGSTWTSMGTPSPAAALLLPDSARVRFLPLADFNGEVKLWYHAWDQSEGTAGGTLDVFASTSASAVWESAALTVSPLNDAPVLDDSLSPALRPAGEDALTPASTRVSDLLAGAITDVDVNPVQGIAVTSASTFFGAWEYSLDDGVTYVSMGAPSPGAALLLPPSARVRFMAQSDFNGTVKLWYHAWDQTAGTAGGTLSVLGQPNTASTSAQWESADLVVLPVNDAPVITVGGPVGYVHDAAPILLAPSASVTDIDSDNLDGGRLKAQITTGASSSNRLAIGAGFTVDENDNVLQGATIIGRRAENGFGTNDLVIWFNANATPFKVQQLVRAITFKTVGGVAGQRQVVFNLKDGDGGLSADATKVVNVT